MAAGEWDDNANYREFLKYAAANRPDGAPLVDVSNRQFVVVKDAQGKAVPGCSIAITDGEAHSASLVTFPSGRTPIFPAALGLVGGTLSIKASCEEGSSEQSFALDGEDGVFTLQLEKPRRNWDIKPIDLAFVIDTTGSMGEEIDALKKTIDEVTKQLTPEQHALKMRIGLVAYKDYGDSYVTQTYPFSEDLLAFRQDVSGLSADGGGDTPEAFNEALHAASALEWREDAFARYTFVIADAPPHFDESFSYASEMKAMMSRGIKAYTVSASGQDDVGQFVFRQVAQYTYATNLFILFGGAGPQSTGGGDPKTSCGGTQTQFDSGVLHSLILGKILRDLADYDDDPASIPGLKIDVKDTPCPPESGGAGGAAGAGGGGAAGEAGAGEGGVGGEGGEGGAGQGGSGGEAGSGAVGGEAGAGDAAGAGGAG